MKYPRQLVCRVERALRHIYFNQIEPSLKNMKKESKERKKKNMHRVITFNYLKSKIANIHELFQQTGFNAQTSPERY